MQHRSSTSVARWERLRLTGQRASGHPTLQRPGLPGTSASARTQRGKEGICSAVLARWGLDARQGLSSQPHLCYLLQSMLDRKYGCKAAAVVLMQEWVSGIGAAAGLHSNNTRLSSGAIGVPESRIELEVTLSSVTEWESFLAAIPATEHKAWSQRLQGLVVDGSPCWQLYHTVDISLPQPPSQQAASASAAGDHTLHAATMAGSKTAGGLFIPYPTPSLPPLGTGAEKQVKPSTEQSTQQVDDANADVVLDWKGEPMHIRKGDKMPKFL
ncbi:hypothetical protein QJQ45_025194 [Haematococcus lacustris]|nr:hypothetical protein QJQ45_025194 [Haematococcus lacustris]